MIVALDQGMFWGLSLEKIHNPIYRDYIDYRYIRGSRLIWIRVYWKCKKHPYWDEIWMPEVLPLCIYREKEIIFGKKVTNFVHRKNSTRIAAKSFLTELFLNCQEISTVIIYRPYYLCWKMFGLWVHHPQKVNAIRVYISVHTVDLIIFKN